MIASLMRSRRFAPMFWCQFFAALGDNFLKNTLALIVLFELGKEEGGAAAQLLEFSPTGRYLREVGKNLYAWSYAHAVKIDIDVSYVLQAKHTACSNGLVLQVTKHNFS